MIERALRGLSNAAGDRRMAMVIPLATPALAAHFPNATAIVLMLGALGALLRPRGGAFAIPPPLRSAAMCVSALAVWAALSAFWSIQPEQSLVRALKFAVLGLCGLILLRAALRSDEEERRLAGLGLLAGLCLLLLQLAVEIVTGGMFVGILHPSVPSDPAVRLLNLRNGGAVLAILLWPGAVIAARRFSLPAAAAFVLLTAGLILYIDLGSVGLALIVGGLAMALVRFGPRRASAVIIALSVLAVVFAPVLPRAIPAGAWMRDIPSSLRVSVYHRSKIWSFAAERILWRPFLGWGMDGARSIPGGDTMYDINRDLEYEKVYGVLCDLPSAGGSTQALPPRPGVELAGPRNSGTREPCTTPPYGILARALPLHPHNAPLQLWLELGAVGALLGAALIYLAQFAINRARYSVTDKAAAFGAFTAAFVVAGLSYGIWQSWWQATLWLTAVILVGIVRPANAEPAQ